MRLARFFLIIFIAAIIEAVLNFRIFSVRLEIILLVLVFLSLKVNSRNALYLGCFAGLLKDTIAISQLGQHVLLFGLLAYSLNKTKRLFYEIPEYIPVIAAACVLLVYGLTFLFLKASLTNSSLNIKVALYLFLVIFFNTLLSPALFKILKKCV